MEERILKVVCNFIKDFSEFTINKQYDVINMRKYIYDENGYNKHTYYHVVNDKGKLTSVSSNYFITLEEWRENQLNKIL